MRFILRTDLNRDRAAQAVMDTVVGANPPMEVVIQEHKPRRDREHSDAMHSRIRQLAEFCGYTHDELNTAVKRNLGLFTEKEVLGERQRFLKSSKDFTNEDCRLVMDYLETTAAELGFAFEREEL